MGATLSPFTSFVVLVFVVAIGLLIFASGLRAHRPPIAVSAPASPSRVPARATDCSDVRLCATRGHVTAPWATTEAFQPVCTRCGHVIERRAPYDQTLVELERMWEAS